MKICPNCGASNPDNISRCEYCRSCIGNEEIDVDTSIKDIKATVYEKEKYLQKVEDKLDEVFKVLSETKEGTIIAYDLSKYHDKLQAEHIRLTGRVYQFKSPLKTKISTKELLITIISSTSAIGFFTLLLCLLLRATIWR